MKATQCPVKATACLGPRFALFGAGVEVARSLLDGSSFRAGPHRTVADAGVRDTEALKGFIRQNCITVHHPVGTCRMEVVSRKEVRIRGLRRELLRTLTAASGVEAAVLGVRGFEPKWRARQDSNL